MLLGGPVVVLLLLGKVAWVFSTIVICWNRQKLEENERWSDLQSSSRGGGCGQAKNQCSKSKNWFKKDSRTSKNRVRKAHNVFWYTYRRAYRHVEYFYCHIFPLPWNNQFCNRNWLTHRENKPCLHSLSCRSFYKNKYSEEIMRMRAQVYVQFRLVLAYFFSQMQVLSITTLLQALDWHRSISENFPIYLPVRLMTNANIQVQQGSQKRKNIMRTLLDWIQSRS